MPNRGRLTQETPSALTAAGLIGSLLLLHKHQLALTIRLTQRSGVRAPVCRQALVNYRHLGRFSLPQTPTLYTSWEGANRLERR